MNAVRNEGSSKKAASRVYGIPCATLIRYLQRKEKVLHLGAFGFVFSPAEELELVNHIIAMESTCYRITAKKARSLDSLCELCGEVFSVSIEGQG